MHALRWLCAAIMRDWPFPVRECVTVSGGVQHLTRGGMWQGRYGFVDWIPDLFANPKIDVSKRIRAPKDARHFGEGGTIQVVGEKGLLIPSPEETVHHSQSPSQPPNSTLRVGV